MKIILPILAISCLLSILGFTLYTSGVWGFYIEQKVSNCNDDTHFQVYTYIFKNGKIIYNHRTWSYSLDNCYTIDTIGVIKKSEHEMAESFIIKYKSIK